MHQLILKVVERDFRYPVIKRHLITDLQREDIAYGGIEVASRTAFST
jgi:hypothetical protein